MLNVTLKLSSITAFLSAQGNKELSMVHDYRQASPWANAGQGPGAPDKPGSLSSLYKRRLRGPQEPEASLWWKSGFGGQQTPVEEGGHLPQGLSQAPGPHYLQPPQSGLSSGRCFLLADSFVIF